jgi:hypothetical protein
MLEIFIPFWGEPALLFEAVESVRAQTDPDWRREGDLPSQ